MADGGERRGRDADGGEIEASWRRDGGEMEAATRVAATSGESGEAVATHPNPNPNQSAELRL